MTDPTGELLRWLENTGVVFEHIRHAAEGRSDFVARERAAAGYGDSVGAKALLCINELGFFIVVIPGTSRLHSRTLRDLVGKFRFASPFEFGEATGGLLPGALPPFSDPVIKGVVQLFADVELLSAPVLAFNAASLNQSILFRPSDYQQALLSCAGVQWVTGVSVKKLD
jgi:prolyl-tRNA editing enzyme YbaK/EbsC (Cys-tRNA(Pro) deacylase)